MVRMMIALLAFVLVQTGGTQAQESAFPDLIPARKQFGYVLDPVPLKARAIGFYTKGCLAGGEALPVDGAAWQAMRLSRNRNWGHPNLIRYVKRLARDVREHDGWPGLLVGDLAQPRGGPMLTGHRSHQVGLDADIWLTPMPDRRLTRNERETMSAVSMLASKTRVDHDKWTPAHVRLLRRAVSYPEVERIFVHPAIKKALCDAAGADKSWLAKIRPFWGHHYHFHVRLRCPKDSPECRAQKPPPTTHQCGEQLDYWFRLLTRPPKKKKAKKATRPWKPLTVDGLPRSCKAVLSVGSPPLLGHIAPTSSDVPLPSRHARR